MKFLKNLFNKNQEEIPDYQQIYHDLRETILEKIYTIDGRFDPIKRELTQNELQMLDKWLQSDGTKLAMRVMEAQRPTVFDSSIPADVRLYQLQGWEMFRDRMQQVCDQGRRADIIEENFQPPEL